MSDSKNLNYRCNLTRSFSKNLSFDDVYQKVRTAFLKHHPNGDTALMDKAFNIGRLVHDEQCRKSGEPYFFHPLAVAELLADWHLDVTSITCGLLHDVVEDTYMTNNEVKKQFGQEIADIVDGLTKISKFDLTNQTILNAENVRKLLVAMDKDVRVLLVKLADRLHNMRTIGYIEEEKRRRIARETIELYAPLANRLGMSLVRAELEDLAFATLEPEHYLEMRNIIDLKHKNSANVIDNIKRTLLLQLRSNGIAAEIFFRIKHLYSLWKKMGAQKKCLNDIYDWLAYRIICPDRASCYTALGLVHNLYRPIPGSFKDYISLPKDNGYRSIHTSVLMSSGESFEVQFRTHDMDEYAEVGIAAHWTYKDGCVADNQTLSQASFLRRMVELYKDSRDSRELVANLKSELKFKQIQVFTPKGDLRSLPEKATPIDFAYAIHTEVGHHCAGAKVNGNIVSLKHILHNGDRVEILTRADKKPNRNWLSIVASARAKTKIQIFIREEERTIAVISGKERFERDAKLFDVKLDSSDLRILLKNRIKDLKFANWEGLYAAIGFNRINPRTILYPFIPKTKKNHTEERVITKPSIILVDDNVGIFYTLASCCKPIFGDDIVGYTKTGQYIIVHRTNCPNPSLSASNPECLVTVSWSKSSQAVFNTELRVITENQTDIVAGLSTVIKNSGFSLQRFSGGINSNGIGIFYTALRVRDRKQLVELMSSIRKLKGVCTVERIKGSYFGVIN